MFSVGTVSLEPTRERGHTTTPHPPPHTSSQVFSGLLLARETIRVVRDPWKGCRVFPHSALLLESPSTRGTTPALGGSSAGHPSLPRHLKDSTRQPWFGPTSGSLSRSVDSVGTPTKGLSAEPIGSDWRVPRHPFRPSPSDPTSVPTRAPEPPNPLARRTLQRFGRPGVVGSH